MKVVMKFSTYIFWGATFDILPSSGDTCRYISIPDLLAVMQGSVS